MVQFYCTKTPSSNKMLYKSQFEKKNEELKPNELYSINIKEIYSCDKDCIYLRYCLISSGDFSGFSFIQHLPPESLYVHESVTSPLDL